MTDSKAHDSNFWSTTPGKQRGVVMATGGMVASAHPLATAAGIDVLRQGGNAMDAAIAMAAVTCVVLPSMCGLGGDTFLIHYDAKTGEVEAVNGSGIAPYGANLESFAARGYHEQMPLEGPLSVAVPGSPHAYEVALQRFGTWDLRQAFQPAIEYAERGFPVSEILAAQFRANQAKLARFPETARVFLKSDGSTYQAGEVFRQPDYAASLRLVAELGANVCYQGEIAERLVAEMTMTGGMIGLQELAEHQSNVYRLAGTDHAGGDGPALRLRFGRARAGERRRHSPDG